MKFIVSLVAVIILIVGLAGCSSADPILDDIYTEGDIYVRADDGTFVALENADFNKYDDLRTPVNVVRVPGAKAPTWTSYKSSEVLAFSDQAVESNEERVYFTIQIPHSYREGSNVCPHIHWVPEDNTGGNVRWALTYVWANEDAILGVVTTIYMNAAAGTTTDMHVFSNFGDILGSGKTISSILLCSLSRNSSDAQDTYNGKDAYLLEIDFHYLKDSAGSTRERIK